MDFNKLERAVLNDLIASHPESAVIAAQLVGATVIGRENSGAGYFTDLEANRSAPPLKSAEQPLNAAWVAIKGIGYPVAHHVWTKDGYLDQIECWMVEGDSSRFDWADVEFTMLPDGPTSTKPPSFVGRLFSLLRRARRHDASA